MWMVTCEYDNGNKTSLPKRYVSRQKLCLRGLTDYWVNDATGQPFFVVTRAVNAGFTFRPKRGDYSSIVTRRPTTTDQRRS